MVFNTNESTIELIKNIKLKRKRYNTNRTSKKMSFGYNTKSIAATLENIVYLKLRRRGYNVYIDNNLKKEIDFVAIRRVEKVYIQVYSD